MKKKISVVIILVTVVAALLFVWQNGYFDMHEPYSTEDYIKEGNWYYYVEDEKAYIEACRRVADTVEIPEKLGGYPVVGFSEYAVSEKQNKRVKNITIPDSIEFFGFDDLEKTPWYEKQPDGVVYIGKGVCGYKGELPADGIIEIKEGTEHIYEKSFENLQIKGIVLPDTLKTIGYWAFMECDKLESIVIPESIEKIHPQAFRDCTSLGKIEFPDKYIETGYSSFLSVKWLNESTDEYIYAGKNLIAHPGGWNENTENTEITIKEGAVGIADFVFEGEENISYVNIPESCMYISDWAFNSAILKGFRVDENNKYFSTDERGSLYNKDKTKLIKYAIADESTEFIVPSTVTEIADYAFNMNTSLEKVVIHENVERIGNDAFWCCSSIKEFAVAEENKNYSSIDGSLYDKEQTTLFCYAAGKADKTFIVPETVVDVVGFAISCSEYLEEIVVHEKLQHIGTIYCCEKIGENSFSGKANVEELDWIFIQNEEDSFDVYLSEIFAEE